MSVQTKCWFACITAYARAHTYLCGYISIYPYLFWIYSVENKLAVSSMIPLPLISYSSVRVLSCFRMNGALIPWRIIVPRRTSSVTRERSLCNWLWFELLRFLIYPSVMHEGPRAVAVSETGEKHSIHLEEDNMQTNLNPFTVGSQCSQVFSIPKNTASSMKISGFVNDCSRLITTKRSKVFIITATQILIHHNVIT